MTAIKPLGARGPRRVSCKAMHALLTYLRQHKWQRRLLTISLTMTLGAGAAVICLPWVQDIRLIRDMDNADFRIRDRAVAIAARRAEAHPAIIGRMEAALDGASDRQFFSLVRALQLLGQFESPGRDPVHIDRLHAYEIAKNPSLKARGMFFVELLTGGRDNQYVREALQDAAADPNDDIRAMAGMLAARLGDDAALGKLLGDDDPNVVQAAAIDAGLTGRKAVLGDINRLLADANDDGRLSGGAYALASLDAKAAAGKLPALLNRAIDANKPDLRDRLLYVMGTLDDPATADAVIETITRNEQTGQYPPAAALLAAGRRKLTRAAPAIRRVLVGAVGAPKGLLVRQVHAAILAADDLKLPVRKEVHDICRKLWTWRPGFRLMLTDAARVLGKQLTVPQNDDPNAPSPVECARTLRRAIDVEYPPTTAPSGEARPSSRHTPLPSAAAAVALWKFQTQQSVNLTMIPSFVMTPASDEVSLSGDHLAWNIGITGSKGAFELGLWLLPALNDPNKRVYNNDARSTGAMLLAVAAATPKTRKQAAERVRSRLEGGQLGGEDNFYVRGAYQCALAILGDPNSPAHVLGLLETEQFSQRRAITALTLAGEFRGIDWLLWNTQVDQEDMLLLLVDDQIGDVIADCLAPLPRISPAAGTDLARWQLLILRHAYAIRRPALKPRLDRGSSSASADKPS